MNKNIGLVLLASASFAAIAAFGENVVTPRYYVGDSLIAMYDGVYNATNAAGAWVHDASATNWLDLSGNGHDFTVTSGGSWTASTFEFNGPSATLSPALPYYRTQEIRCKVDSGRWVFCGSEYNGLVQQGLVTVKNYTKRFQTSFVNPKATTKWLNADSFTAPFTTTVTYGPLNTGSIANYCNATATPSLADANSWSSSSMSSIGALPQSTSFNGKGRIYSVRLYDRELTTDEIARNYLVDRVRFEGVTPPEALEPAIACVQTAGGSSGEAHIFWSVTSFGWLGSSITSLALEYSATSDFASPSTNTAVVPPGATWGVVTFSGLEPGATYHARALLVNNLGAEAEGSPFTFTAVQGASRPVAQLVGVRAAPTSPHTSAEADVEVVYVPAGFDVLAVLSRNGETYTNVIAKGVSSTGVHTWAIPYLAPETDYAVEILVRYGGTMHSAGSGTFSTSATVLPHRAYVQNGLLLQLDGLFNAVTPGGLPFHDTAATNWTDLTGNMSFVSGGSGAPLAFSDDAAIFPGSVRYLHANDATNISDAVLSGNFTVEAAAALTRPNTGSDVQYGLYSLGSGSYDPPRTLCFDLRHKDGYDGCIQYNTSAYSVDSLVLVSDGTYFTNSATLAVVGSGLNKNATLYRAVGSSSIATVKSVSNKKKYTTASAIAKVLRLRYYSGSAAETIFNAFRAYNRSLTAEELGLNAAVDAVRFRGSEPPTPIEPSVSLLCLDAGVEGAVSVNWMLNSAGWPASALASLTMEYSESPDFDDAVSVTLGTDIAESGSATLSGLVPGDTYWARGVATNEVGTVLVIDTFSFRASSGAGGAPVFTTTSATAASGSATFDLSLVLDGGAPCGGYAVLSHDGHVSTNTLFSGVSAPAITTLTLAPLAPGANYTAVIAVTNGLGDVAEEATLTFTTAPDNAFVNPYVEDGLIGLFDGLFNALDGARTPIHHPQPAAWTDLKGNFPTVASGTITYSENGVTHVGAAYTACNSAAAAVNAILSNTFTVETLCRFASRSTTSDHFYPLFSFGSGYGEFPRALCMDTRLSGGLYGALQFNCSAWNSNAMMLHELDFTKMATYSVVGGGSRFNDDVTIKGASLYVNGEYTNAVPNNNGYTRQTVTQRKFAIHRYYDNTAVSALYHSFRIYDRSLTDEEIAANRVADEVRFLGNAATLDVASATRAGQALSVTLVRGGVSNPADIFILTASEYGQDTERATGCRFAEGETTAALTVTLPAGTAYVRFKAGGLVSPLVMVDECALAGGYAISTPIASDTGVASATLAAAVSVPDGGSLGGLSAAYGYAPDALVWTNALAGAGSVSESGSASGLLAGLRPSRTYYCRLFGTGGGETVEADTIARFTTADAEETPDTCIRVVATNRVNGVISSLTVEVDSERATELWLFGDLADGGCLSNGWAYAEKLFDVPAGGGTFNVPAPAGWGSSILAFRLAAGLAEEVESVSYAGNGIVQTELMPTGALRIDIDFASATVTAQQRVFSLGSSAADTLIVQLYRNSGGKWAYAWNKGDGNWESTGVAADTARHRFTLDGINRAWILDGQSGILNYNTAPYAAEPDLPLRFFGYASGSSGSAAPGTLWSCQVYGIDGLTLLGDFRPAVSGGEACLYDLVSRKILFPTTGSLTAGAAVDGDILLVEPTAPFLYASANDVELGTDVVVTGHETGDTLIFSGTSRNAEHVTVNGREATLSADGTWTITIADGIVPGVPYECRVLATAGDAMDTLPVFTETTLAGSQLYWKTTALPDQRTVTFSGKLSVSGANDTTVRLLTGPSADALTNTIAVAKPFDDAPSFTLVWHPPVFDEEYFWAITIENAASNPANGHWTSSTATNSFFTRDAAIYTWQPVDGDWSGDWSDPAHWGNDKDGDILGWPQTPTATAYIPQGTVNADTNVTVKTIVFGNDGLVTLTSSGHTLGTTSYGDPYNVVPNGAEVLVTGDIVLNLLNTISLGGSGANLTSYAASFTVADGATFTAREVDLAFDGVFRVRDASVTLSGVYFHHSNSDGTSDTAYGTTRGTLRIEGTSPLLTVTTNLRGFNNNGTRAGGVIEFCVPRGGYARTPIVMTGTGKGYTFCGDSKVSGNSKAVTVRIADDSPLYGMGGTVDLELATWRVKHTDGAALVSLNPLRGADHNPRRRLYITDDDLSLRVQFNGGFTMIMLR